MGFVLDASNPGSYLLRDTIRVTELVAASRQLPQPGARERVLRHLFDANSLDESLKQWESHVPPYWRVVHREDPKWSNDFAYHGKADV